MSSHFVLKGERIMLEAYSTDVEVAVDAAVPFNNVTLEKGWTALLVSPGTINLNKCGVYMVSFDGSVAASTMVQLFKDGIAQPQAQSTSATSPTFTTLVQVERNNSNCACTSPVTLQVRNVGAAEATFTNANICVTKVC